MPEQSAVSDSRGPTMENTTPSAQAQAAAAAAANKRKLAIHAKKAIDSMKGVFDLKSFKRFLANSMGVEAKSLDADIKGFLATSVQKGLLTKAEGKYRAVTKRRSKGKKSKGKKKSSKKKSKGKKPKSKKRPAKGALPVV